MNCQGALSSILCLKRIGNIFAGSLYSLGMDWKQFQNSLVSSNFKFSSPRNIEIGDNSIIKNKHIISLALEFWCQGVGGGEWVVNECFGLEFCCQPVLWELWGVLMSRFRRSGLWSMVYKINVHILELPFAIIIQVYCVSWQEIKKYNLLLKGRLAQNSDTAIKKAQRIFLGGSAPRTSRTLLSDTSARASARGGSLARIPPIHAAPKH